MASQVFNIAKKGLFNGAIDLDTNTIKARLVMTNTTVDTENDAKNFLSDFTTIDVCDSSGYTDKTLSTLTVTQDDTNDLAKWTADNLTWTSLATCTRQIQGVLIYKFVTNDAGSTPICFVQFSSNKTPDGSDFTVAWDSSNGILTLT